MATPAEVPNRGVSGARLSVDQRDVAEVIEVELVDVLESEIEEANHGAILCAPDDSAVGSGRIDTSLFLQQISQRR